MRPAPWTPLHSASSTDCRIIHAKRSKNLTYSDVLASIYLTTSNPLHKSPLPKVQGSFETSNPSCQLSTFPRNISNNNNRRACTSCYSTRDPSLSSESISDRSPDPSSLITLALKLQEHQSINCFPFPSITPVCQDLARLDRTTEHQPPTPFPPQRSCESFPSCLECARQNAASHRQADTAIMNPHQKNKVDINVRSPSHI
jgi:hypothetical protein